MKIIIVTGQEGSDVESLFHRIISEQKYTYDDAHKWYFLRNLVCFTIQIVYITIPEEL